jgi:hypothetical protein
MAQNSPNKQLTWAQVKSWAGDNKVPDDAQVFLVPARGERNLKCLDLDQWEAEGEDLAAFFLQGYWG